MQTSETSVQFSLLPICATSFEATLVKFTRPRYSARKRLSMHFQLCDTRLPDDRLRWPEIGNTRRVELKAGWTEPAILWTASISESGTGKSPVDDLALGPIRELEQAAQRNHEEALRVFDARQIEHDKELASWRRSKNSQVAPPAAPKLPVLQRFSCSDTTIAALTDRWDEKAGLHARSS